MLTDAPDTTAVYTAPARQSAGPVRGVPGACRLDMGVLDARVFSGPGETRKSMNSEAHDRLEIREFTAADYACLPAMFAWLEPELPAGTVTERVPAMQAQGWRCVGAFAGGELIGMAGYGVRHHLFSGPVMYVENVAVLPNWRAQRIGVRLMQWIEVQARMHDCNKITLDAYAVNAAARNFYQRLGYDPRGVHFVLDL